MNQGGRKGVLRGGANPGGPPRNRIGQGRGGGGSAAGGGGAGWVKKGGGGGGGVGGGGGRGGSGKKGGRGGGGGWAIYSSILPTPTRPGRVLIFPPTPPQWGSWVDPPRQPVAPGGKVDLQLKDGWGAA